MTDFTPYIITIGGGSGSGKTTFAKRVKECFDEGFCQIISQDSYYHDQSNKFDHDGGSVNFDHPNAIDFLLMSEHQDQIKNKKPVDVPIYDFATHKRREEVINITPSPIILVDGILVLSQSNIRERSDLLVYIDCSEDLRFERRLNRDVRERGRTPEGVKNQFFKQVKPMHDLFVETNKHHAHIIVTVETFDSDVEKLKNIINKEILK